MPEWATRVNMDMADSGKAVYGDTVNTIGLKNKATGMVVISANWVNGAVDGIVAKSVDVGGWESVVFAPNGDGTVSIRSSYSAKYVTLNDDNVLEFCDKTTEELTNREKFIINSDVALDQVTGLKVTDTTLTSISISWDALTNNVLSGYEVWRKTSEDDLGEKIADVAGTTYVDDSLSPNQTRIYEVRAVNGKGSTDYTTTDILTGEFSESVTASTVAGERPASPSNMKIEELGNNQVKLTWNASTTENVTYELYAGVSKYSLYEKIADVNGTEATVTYTTGENGTKYNYYKAVAKSDVGVLSKLEDIEGVSLETNLFGDHTLVFADTDDTATIDNILKNLFIKQNDSSADAQFQADHYQVYFKSGDYKETSCIYLGFYTSINGLGETPYDVELNNMAIPAYLTDNNATCNFWRSAENFSIINTGNSQGLAQYDSWRSDQFNWAVAQAAPLRRIYSTRKVAYDWNYGWASGGYVADCYFDAGTGDIAGIWSGQQFYTRNTDLSGNAFGTTLNNFLQGCTAANLPTDDALAEALGWEALASGEGYTNWGVADEKGNQQVATSITSTEEIAEKPFLYVKDGEYYVFVPSVQENRVGTSWSEDDMGEGTSIPLSEFYIANPEDSAATINAQIDAGKHIYLTPGIYHAEETIKVDQEGTIVLGTGLATIIPDNDYAAMEIADVDGVRVAGIIFDAGEHSEYLLVVGEEGSNEDHSNNPIILQDIFYRIGGTTSTLTKADNGIIINSSDVLCDHFWIWRADHGAGVAWNGNESAHGLVVNGDDVTCYALFNEHFQNYTTLWNGENGKTYFYQNETAYDPVSQESWMSHNGTVNGYASYKVSNDVTSHYAVGLGIYNVFIYTGGGGFNEGKYDGGAQIQLDNGIEVPNASGVLVENACMQTFAEDGSEGGLYQVINHIINDVGGSVSSGFYRQEIRDEETGAKIGNLLDADGNELPTKVYIVDVTENEHGGNKITYVVRELDSNGNDIVLNGSGEEYALEKLAEQNITYTIDETTGELRLYNAEGYYIDSESYPYIIPVRKEPVGKAVTGDGWARVFLLSYNNGTAIVGKKPTSDQKMKYIGTETITGIKQLGDDDLDVAGLEALIAEYETLSEENYTAGSWATFVKALADAKAAVANEDDFLKYALEEDFNAVVEALTTAKDGLVVISELANTYETNKDKVESDYTADTWAAFEEALANAKDVLANENATQEEIDEANDALLNAASALKAASQSGTTNPGTTNPGTSTTPPSSDGNTTNQPSQGNNNVQISDIAMAPYAIMAFCAAAGYVTLRRKRED